MPVEMMRAMRLRQWGGPFIMESVPIPAPTPHQVQVKVLSVGIGVTNELARNGVLGGSVPRTPGHEFAGVVSALGSEVTGWSIGDRVTSTFYVLCGTCRWCAGGREQLCENFGGFLGIAVDGAFAEYLTIAAQALVRLPASVPLRDAGIISDAIATAYHAIVARAGVEPGERVAVIGAGGGLGVHVLQIARAVGAWTLAVEIDPTKADALRARELADEVIVPDRDNPDGLREQNRAVDVVVDTYGGSATLSLGYGLLGRGGRLIVLGQVPEATLSVSGADLIFNETIVSGTRYATRAEIAAAADLVAAGRVRPIIGSAFPLEQLNEALGAAVENRVFGRIRIDMDTEES